MATSFKKKGSRGRAVYPAGTRVSLHNNQLLASTGIPSMDNVIGGGLAVGTVLMIEEDTYGSYARQMLKYFLAEGVVCGHGIFLASAEFDPRVILKDLPQVVGDSREVKTSATQAEQPSGNDSMKIAWRYQNLPKFQSNPSHVQFGHYYDLTQVMNEDQVMQSVKVDTFNVMQELEQETNQSDENPVYRKLLSSIKSVIEQGRYSISASQQHEKTILRLALHGLGSVLWGENGSSGGGTLDVALTRFLYALRATLRSTFAVCLITVPTHLFQDSSLTRRVERLCDTVVSLEAFAGSDQEANPVYKDYHGLFHIVRVPRLNSLTCHVAESQELAFKLRRKKLIIEKLHLPPDLSETASRSQLDSAPGQRAGLGTLACHSQNNPLDF